MAYEAAGDASVELPRLLASHLQWWAVMPALVQSIPEGPLAIVGDVHGEIDALERLLDRLGAGRGQTPSRRLIFVGDLVDRGPDSIAVVERVRDLVDRGQAFAVLGNHELNLLENARKEGNGWYFGESDFARLAGGKRVDFVSRLAKPSERVRIREFLSTLPLVLERDDLRVVHACWPEDAFSSLPAHCEIAPLAASIEETILADLHARGVTHAARAERAEFANLLDHAIRPDRHLTNVAEEDSALQSRNPIKLITSGTEVAVEPGQHFFANGKWRFVSRDRWWRRPIDRPTVVGHYWRRRDVAVSNGSDAWDGIPPYMWNGNVFCVDYSIGRRFAERAMGIETDFRTGLGAMLWPEREIVFEDREGVIPARDQFPQM